MPSGLTTGFANNFFERSTVHMQLFCCLGKQGELSENCLQNLGNDLMADSVYLVAIKLVTYMTSI